MDPQTPAGNDPAPSAPVTDDNDPQPGSDGTPQDPAQVPEIERPPEPPAPEEPPANPPAEEPPATRSDRRTERLAERLRSGSMRRQAYRDQLTPPQPPSNYEPLDYSKLYDFPQGQEDVQKLEQDRQAYAKAMAEQTARAAETKVQQEFFLRDLEMDGDRVASRYTWMDEQSSDFDPDLASTVNEMYLAAVGAQFDQQGNVVSIGNPTVRYKDYVEAFAGALDRFSSSRNADSATNIAQQSARTGVRPNAGNQRTAITINDPSDIAKLSDAEYEKYKEQINSQINSALGI